MLFAIDTTPASVALNVTVNDVISSSNLKVFAESCPQYLFLTAGDIDKENPSSISEKELEEWITSGIIRYIPFTEEIKQLLCETHITVLPSYREGMPKILLEASAIGRPIVTTTAPGCDECVIDNYNGNIIKQ